MQHSKTHQNIATVKESPYITLNVTAYIHVGTRPGAAMFPCYPWMCAASLVLFWSKNAAAVPYSRHQTTKVTFIAPAGGLD